MNNSRNIPLLSSSPGYAIQVNNHILDGWHRLSQEHPGQMAELKQLLKHYPDNLRPTNGKAKKLKGRLKEYYQYDVTYSDRVRYRVDKKNRIVYVDYAGPHP